MAADGRPRRVGISTGGGDCPGLNAVIRAFVKAIDAIGGWEVVGIRDGLDGLFRRDGILELTTGSVRGLLTRGGTVLGTNNRGSPFVARTIVDGKLRAVDRSADARARLRELEIDALLMIGGDGSQTIALELQGMGIPVVGVPKTIDNDLSSTDATFGFDTAVTTATEAIDKLNTTAESHHRVMIVEVMGRHAGWIALEAGLAGGAEIILIPEIPFRVERIAEHVGKRDRRGWTFSLVVVAEGAHPVGGAPLTLATKDPLAPVRLGGIGIWLGEELGKQTHHEVRVTVLGHVQRGGSPTPFDRVLATRFGVGAARLVEAGDWGKLVALRGSEIVAVPIEDCVRTRKTVPLDGEGVSTARLLGISFGD